MKEFSFEKTFFREKDLVNNQVGGRIVSLSTFDFRLSTNKIIYQLWQRKLLQQRSA